MRLGHPCISQSADRRHFRADPEYFLHQEVNNFVLCAMVTYCDAQAATPKQCRPRHDLSGQINPTRRRNGRLPEPNGDTGA